MEDVVFKLEAVDPWDGDTYEIGFFTDEEKANYAKKKYEYTTDTGYSKALVTPISLDSNYLLNNDIANGYNRIGFFGILDDDNKFIMLRDKIAFSDSDFICHDDIMYNMTEDFDYFKDIAIEAEDDEVRMLYTEVPYSEIDTQMETEASEKFLKYLHDKK